MSIFLISILVVLVVIAMIGIAIISSYNRLVRLNALLDEAWSGIDIQLKRRYDLIPNLVATVEAYSVHEKTIFERIAHARAAAMSAHSIEAKSNAEIGLSAALRSLFAVVENYPDLKAAENFLALQQQLSTIELELQLARRYYNGAARNYNTAIATVPTSVIASAAGFGARPYFELSDTGHRENPSVSFKHK
jgi:LemA protein